MMDKLKSLASATTSKTANIFRSNSGDNLHSVLTKQDRKQEKLSKGRRERSDPFIDAPSLEEPTLPKAHIWIHLVTVFFTFLAVCTIGATAGFQAKWFGVSGGTGFTIFLLVLNFFLTTFLLSVPLIYDRWDKLRRPAQFLQQARSTVILHIFGTLINLIAAIIVTVSAFASPGCKAVDNDPHASLGDDFKNGLDQWCTTKKACAVFCWLALGGWIALTVLAILTFRRERSHEPTFLAPSSPVISQHGGGRTLGYSQVNEDEKATDVAYSRPSDVERDVGLYNHSVPSSTPNRPVVQRYESRMSPVQTTGGAFPLGGAGAGEPSRTLQVAYSDPYAQVRASLMQNAQEPHQQQYYAQGGLPAPPSYGRYR